MPVGFPKDPVAHAAVLAANRAEKEKITKHGHRTYRRGTATSARKTVVTASVPNEYDVRIIALENEKARLEREVDDLSRKANKMQQYLFTVLDLVVNQK